MKEQKILNISSAKYTGYVYNLELESDSEKDDLFWIEQDSKVVSHNCFPKDLGSFLQFGKSLGLNMTMFNATKDVNDRVRDVKDWENIVGATSDNNYRKD